MHSASIFPALVRDLGIDVEFERSGSLMVAQTPLEWESLVCAQEAKRRQGLDIRFLDKDAIRAIEPYLDTTHVAGASYSPDEGQVNPLLYTLALARRSREAGATIMENCPVEGFDVSGGRVHGVFARGERIECGAAVITAGAWSYHVGAILGIEIPIDFVVGEALITEALPRVQNNYFALASFFETAHSAGQAASPCCAQTWAGNMLIGEASQKAKGIQAAAIAESRLRNMYFTRAALSSEIVRFFPVIKTASLIRMWRTLAPFTSDHRPVLGSSDEVGGLIICAGFKSTVVMTPLVGRIVKGLLTEGNRSLSREVVHSGFSF
jgi:sarcosine oxidase subunit beta